MGMFDSFYEADGTEWQTKAYENQLAAYRAGDKLPALEAHPDLADYQVEVLGGRKRLSEPVDSFTTVVGGRVHEINADRDTKYPRVSYGGYLYQPGAEESMTEQPRETDTLDFEVIATAKSGIQVPIRVTIEYPKDHGFYAVQAIDQLSSQTEQFYRQMLNRSDMSTIQAIMNMQNGAGDDDE